MGVFEDIVKNQGKLVIPNKEGFMWVTMLIKYDMKGNAEIVRRFVKDAKESDIKMLLKPKQTYTGPVIERKESTEEVSLFE